MDNSTKLKRCPFCGSRAKWWGEGNWIVCTSCSVEYGPNKDIYGNKYTPEELAVRWNEVSDKVHLINN